MKYVESPFYKLRAAIVAAVAEYDRADDENVARGGRRDHDRTHNGVSNHDCVRCLALKAVGLPETWRPHSERAIYEAQKREDARADREGREPRLIKQMGDITDGGMP